MELTNIIKQSNQNIKSSQRINFTVFKHAKDNTPKGRAVESWDRFCAEFLKSEHIPFECDDKEESPAWSPAIFAEGAPRKDENVTAFAPVLPLDFDKSSDGSEGLTDQEVAHIGQVIGDRQCLIHNSYSQYKLPEGRAKLRVILHLDRSPTKEEWPKVWQAAAAKFGLADPSCGNLSRIYFLPACPPGEGGTIHVGVHGREPWSVEELLAEWRPAEVNHYLQERFSERAGKELEKWNKKLKKAPAGDRNTTLNKAAFSLGTQIHFISEEAIIKSLTITAEEIGLAPQEITNTINSGLTSGKEVAVRNGDPTRDWRKDLIWRGGEVSGCVSNIVMILETHPDWSGVLGFNVRHGKPFLLKPLPASLDYDFQISLPSEITDATITHLTKWFARELGIEISTKTLFEAIVAVSKSYSYDPVAKYFQRLEWDGIHRLDNWLIDLCGTEDNDLNRKVGSKWLISAVARTLEPGCQCDYALILESAQGTGKSSVFQEIATIDGEIYYRSDLSKFKDKDSKMELQRCLIMEFGELDSIRGNEVEATKEFMTRRIDSYRAPYGRCVEDHPRRCVFCGTSNGAEYLRDSTGNRRFWPVQIEQCNIEKLREVKDQIWAEAVFRFERGEQWYLSPEDETEMNAEQEQRRHRNPWESAIENYLCQPLHKIPSEFGICDGKNQRRRQCFDSEGKRRFTTTDELLCDCIGLDLSRQESFHPQRVGDCLRALGWTKKRRRGKGSKLEYRYYPPKDWAGTLIDETVLFN